MQMLDEVHPYLQQSVGLDQHIKSPQKKTSKVPLVGKKKSTAVDVPPVIDPNTISDHEVQVCSGFCSLLLLLCYIAVVCDGNILMMVEMTTCLTWFEEWFFFFEMLWGWSLQCWVDAEHVYKLNKKSTTGNIYAKACTCYLGCQSVASLCISRGGRGAAVGKVEGTVQK